MATLPVAAGPWVRTDGFPFAESIDQLLSPNNKVYAPVRYNEFGDLVPAGTRYFTHTQANGTLYYPEPPCSNWSSAASSSNVHTGSSEATSVGWSNCCSDSCGDTLSLLCLQTGTGPSLPNHVSSGKKAFLTSVSGNGHLGSWPDAGGNTGIAAGDAICQARATAAGLANPTHFKAWLSDSTTNAKNRISSDGPWVRLDGVLIANSKSDLLDYSLFTAINVTETMVYAGDEHDVWTGTFGSGMKKTDHCSDWTTSSSGTKGVAGWAYAVVGWPSAPLPSCSSLNSLYCFED
jgi:hypothetical protein